MQISELPFEIIIEIIKFSFTSLKLLPNLSLISKEWNNLITQTFKSEEFCKFIYNSLFSWRNNKDQKTINFQSLLKEELKFWNSWNFHSQPGEFTISKIVNEKYQNLLRIKRLEAVDRKNIITQPIFYNTGVYYFEIKCLQCKMKYDNIFIGFLYQPTTTINNYEDDIEFKSFLGSNLNKDSFGFYFANGDLYRINFADDNNRYSESLSYAEQKIEMNTKVGVYLDTDNLFVRFVLVKEEKCFPMISLKTFLNAKEINKFKNKKLVLYPAISIFYVRGELELNTTAGFRSVEKAEWIKEVVSSQEEEEEFDGRFWK